MKTNHAHRGRITVTPLTSNYAIYHHGTLSRSLPRGWQAEALTGDGLLARNKHTGTLAIWQGFAMAPVDQRKAEAALVAVSAANDSPAAS